MFSGREIILTADRSLMSNYRDNMLFGHIACMPVEKISKFIYYHVFCPSVKANPISGEAEVAPLGLRRIESNLLDEFGKDKVILSHCDHIEKSIGPDTKVLGINVMDPLGVAPLTTSILGGKTYTPYNRYMFGLFMKKINRLKKKYGFKTVIGGYGAWQLSKKEDREIYGVDNIVVGEADGHAAEMINDVIDGSAPDIISLSPSEISNIPYIKGATCNSAIECMRGCGRGCDFCDPNRRVKRDIPIERLKQEAKINLDYGHNYIWLVSDEIMLYGCDNREMYPNRDAILDMYQELKNMGNVDSIGAVHVTYSSVAADPECIEQIRKINNFGPSRWSGVQPGLETGSVKLFKKHMPNKAKPYSPEEWPEVALQGVKILNENYIAPISTLIIGLPGETDDDVQDTIDLVKRMDGLAASIMVPLIYTDFIHPEKSLSLETLNKLQYKLYYLCWQINLKTISKWIFYTTANFPPIFRQIAGTFGKLGAHYQLRKIRDSAKKILGEDPDFDNI